MDAGHALVALRLTTSCICVCVSVHITVCACVCADVSACICTCSAGSEAAFLDWYGPEGYCQGGRRGQDSR